MTVHAPVPKLAGMGMAVGKNQIQRYYEEEGQAALAGAKKKLAAARIKFNATVLVGQVAESIVAHASKSRCDQIFIGTRGNSAAANLLLGSVATKVLHISNTPVLLVR